ncbi:hypothetical protein Q5752_000623 [Cryptotrichosporon argae]
MFIKRAKSRPSLRAREVDNEPSPAAAAGSPLAQTSVTADDVEDGSDAGGSVMARTKARKKAGGKGRLSFGVDDEAADTPFKLKKSLLSQSLRLPPTPNAASAYTAHAAASYSAAYLDELKAATPTRAPRAAQAGAAADDDAADGADDADEGAGASGLSRAAREKYAASLAADTTAGIPDAAEIAAAKLRRAGQAAAARSGLGPGDDYVSLGTLAVRGGGGGGGDAGPHPESRLMREDDDGDDGDEDVADYTGANERLYLGAEARRAARRREIGERGEMVQDLEEDMDDDEAREWERTLVARAGRVELDAPAKKAYSPAAMPAIRPLPSIPSAQARIAQQLAALTLTREEETRTLETVANDLVVLETQERDLRRQVAETESKREWVEEFHGWVDMFGSFLEDKYPKLEAIEADSLSHLRERAQLVRTRRAADDADDLALFLGAPVEQGIAEAGPSAPPRQARRAARAARRAARTAAREDDSYSTDSSLDSDDADQYAAARRELEDRVGALLDDVRAEDFRDPNKGLAVRFADWRTRYSDEYSGAFGGLALVQAWEFYARGEMVGWEPLRSTTTLESFTWFMSLHAYAARADGDGDDMDVDRPGPDGELDLAGEMVHKTVVPLLTRALEAGAYDAYSAPQTRRAVDLADVVGELAGRDSRKFAAFIKAIFAVYHAELVDLARAVAAAALPASFPPPSLSADTRAALARFVRRRIKLIRNILLWRRQAQTEVAELVGRLVGDVLRPALARQWGAGGKELAVQVLAVSSGLLPPGLVAFLQHGPR